MQTASQHEAKLVAITRQGLTRLSQIATLILIAAILAMAAAMGALIWQRRPRLAKLKLEGFAHVELWQTIVLESFLLVGVGCTTGAIFGLLGQQLLDHALEHRDQLPRRQLARLRRGDREPRARDRGRRRDRRRARATSPPTCRRRSRCRTDC